MYYHTGIPFKFAKSLALPRFMKTIRPSYNVPSAKRVGGKLIEVAHTKHQAAVKEFINDSPLISFVTAGWSNIRNEHMVNFVEVFPLCTAIKPILLGTLNTSAVAQTGENIANAIL